MDTVLSLLGIAVFIAGVISFAAGMTWVVVRFSPGGTDDKAPPQTSSS